MDWLIGALELGPTTRLADVGAGVGGPAAYAQQRSGARPVLLEPEHQACRAAARLFELPVVRADALATPFPDAAFDAAWCLGVLCTAPSAADQLRILTELRRIVRPGGAVGLLVFVADGPLDDPPEGNNFPSTGALHSLLDQAGLPVLDQLDARELPDPAAEWTERTHAVEYALQQRYGDREAFQVAEEQSGKIGRLLGSGRLRPQLLRLHRP